MLSSPVPPPSLALGTGPGWGQVFEITTKEPPSFSVLRIASATERSSFVGFPPPQVLGRGQALPGPACPSPTRFRVEPPRTVWSNSGWTGKERDGRRRIIPASLWPVATRTRTPQGRLPRGRGSFLGERQSQTSKRTRTLRHGG